jgi:Protein of unknown function (DUF3313)
MEILRKAFCLLVIAALCACAGHKTERAQRIEVYGYLGDYTMFQKGTPGRALYVYRKPDVDFSDYEKVLLDPVIFYWKHTNRLEEVPEDAQILTDKLQQLLHKELSEYYQMVATPGKNTMRMTVALTDVKKTGTSFGANYLALASKKLSETALDTPALVGEATVEIKITDAASGEMIAAVVDRRLGSGNTEKPVSSWDDVYNVFDYWAGIMGYRLCREFGRKDCKRPQE